MSLQPVWILSPRKFVNLELCVGTHSAHTFASWGSHPLWFLPSSFGELCPCWIMDIGLCISVASHPLGQACPNSQRAALAPTACHLYGMGGPSHFPLHPGHWCFVSALPSVVIAPLMCWPQSSGWCFLIHSGHTAGEVWVVSTVSPFLHSLFWLKGASFSLLSASDRIWGGSSLPGGHGSKLTGAAWLWQCPQLALPGLAKDV